MSITTYLQQILAARYGKDVRQSIHDAIEEGYNIAVAAQDVAQTSQESAEAYAAAALASEQAAQNYMNQAEQYKDEAFSGTPTGYSDLVAKVNSIYKQTASSFGVVGTVEGLALAHTIYGMSEQDGTPTPSVPVTIDSAVANFNCVGKNLNDNNYSDGDSKTASNMTFTKNSDDSVTLNGSNDNASATIYYVCHGRTNSTNPLTFRQGTTVNISGGISNNIKLLLFRTNPDNGNYQEIASDTGNGASYTFSEDNFYVGLQIAVTAGASATNQVVYPMITLDGADQTWEEYKSKTITTGLTLRAIEVTSSDNYNLVKDGKYYIADTLDWNEDNGYSITRRIYGLDLSTLTSWGEVTTETNARRFIHGGTNPRPLFNGNLLSEYFKSASFSALQLPWGEARISAAGNLTLFNNDDGMASISALQTWLSENNPIIYYIVEPYEETITSAQAQALLGLKTYDEATSIDATGDVAPSIDLEYSKDRNTALALIGHNMAHINALKIADLSV